MKKKIQKPFNVEAAKNGAKVETKNGIPVRIICYDREGCQYPILALVDNGSGYESCIEYDLEGKFFCSGPGKHDLVIVEEVEESKFKEGDWVFVYGEHLWLITTVTSNCYEVQNTQGYKTVIPQINIDNYSHLWTIKDAKPGDILVCADDGRPFIFKGVFYSSVPTAYCGIDVLNSIRIGTDNPWTCRHIRPATYKERQLLFNKLEEGGYKWDAESLTISKIQKRWRDDERAQIDGYFINGMSQISFRPGYNTCCYYNIFATEKQAKSALAMAHISQIMANDERFGGVVTYEEGSVNNWQIVRVNNDLLINLRHEYGYLAFHTRKQAELFLKENEDLVKDYYMMD